MQSLSFIEVNCAYVVFSLKALFSKFHICHYECKGGGFPINTERHYNEIKGVDMFCHFLVHVPTS